MPLISIIVPIYKVEKYLSECIDSIIAQTYKNIEIILVDDGSPDMCATICDEYASTNTNVKVIHKSNGGLVSARKTGVNIAEGEYIMFVDGDDFILPDYVKAYAEAIEETNADIVAGGFCTYTKDHVIERIQPIEEGVYFNEQLEKNIYPYMLSGSSFYTFGIYPSLCTKCIRKEIIKRNQKLVSDYICMGEDAAVVYPSLLDCESLCVIKASGYMYRKNESSITHSYDPNMVKKCIELIEHFNKFSVEKSWNIGLQLFDYVNMLQSLLIKNELYSRENCNRDRYENLRIWANNPVVSTILKLKNSGSLPLMYRIELVAVRYQMFWILSLIRLLRKAKWKILNMN